MPDAIETLGFRLAEARQRCGMTQIQLAKRCGFCNATVISRWEQCLVQPTVKHLRVMCDVLDVSADWLLGLTDDL